MAIERETVVTETTTPVQRTTYVGGSSPFGLIGGIVVALLVIALVVMFFNGTFGGRTGSGTVDIDVPSVTVTPDGQ